MKIWLDDLRLPPATDWLWARDKGDFVALIEEFGLPSEISFDHDLGEEYEEEYDVFGGGMPDVPNGKFTPWPKETGYDCAKWLIHYVMDNPPTNVTLVSTHGELKTFKTRGWPKWKVHSANPVGAENITKLLENYEKHLNT